MCFGNINGRWVNDDENYIMKENNMLSKDQPKEICYEYVEIMEPSKTPGIWPIKWVLEEEFEKEFPRR